MDTLTEVQEQDPIPKLKVKEFAAKIKAKYPQYKDIDDKVLTDKIISKYPDYKEQVDFTEEVKKKEPTVLPSQSSGGRLPSVAKEIHDFDVFDIGKTLGAKPQTQESAGFTDKSFEEINSRKTKKLLSKPLIPTEQQVNQPVSTQVVQPKITASYDDFVAHNAERQAKKESLRKEAVENTAMKVLKNKGVIKPEEEGKALNLSKFSQLSNEKKKLQEALDNGDATFAISPEGEVGLKRTIGWWEALSKGWNSAMKSNDEAADFAEMDAAKKVEFLHKKEAEQETNEHPEYIGERPGALGSAGQLVGENAPFLGKAAAGGIVGTALTMAAPATGGVSTAGIPIAMSFLFTAEDSKNAGIQQEVTRRFYQLKKENPEVDDVTLMKEAEQGALIGGLTGIATNAALMTSIKTPLSNVAKGVVGKSITKAIGNSVYGGAATAALEGAKLAEGNLEGIRATPTEIAKDMGKTFSETTTNLGLLHVMTGAVTGAVGLPKMVRSAIKYALRETDPKVINATLDANVEAGTITKTTADKVKDELAAYNAAADKVVDGLSPEAHASVAGLIEAKDKLIAEMKTKDDSAKPYYEEKIDGINQQIQKTINTGKPYAFEVDEISGEKYTGETKVIEMPNLGDKITVTKVEEVKPEQPKESNVTPAQSEPSTQAISKEEFLNDFIQSQIDYEKSRGNYNDFAAQRIENQRKRELKSLKETGEFDSPFTQKAYEVKLSEAKPEPSTVKSEEVEMTEAEMREQLEKDGYDADAIMNGSERPVDNSPERKEYDELKGTVLDHAGNIKKGTSEKDKKRLSELQAKFPHGKHIILKPDDATLLPLLDDPDFSVRREVVDYKDATENALLKAVKQQSFPGEVALRAVRNKNATEKVLNEGLKHTDPEVRFAAQEALDKLKSETKPISNEGTTGQVNEPISKNEGQSKEQGVKEVIPSDVNKVEPVATEGGTTVLNKENETKTTEIPKPEKKDGASDGGTNQAGKKSGEGKAASPTEKDLGTRAREEAAKYESGEKSVLPSWMKAKLPPGTKIKGIDIDRAYANALRAFAEVHDKTKDFKKAIEEGFKHIKDWFNDNGIPIDENEMKGHFENEVRGGEPPKGNTEPATGGGDKFGDKGILNRLHQADNVPAASKKGFEEKGLKYVPQSHQEAEAIAKGVVDQYGIDDAITLAETGRLKGGVSSAVFAESLNRLYNEELNAKTPEAKLEAAKKFAEVGIRYDEVSREQGRDISQIGHFYKKSPLGIKLMEEAKRQEDFAEFSKKKDQSWKEFFDEMTKDPEFEKEFKTRVSEELKKERAELRKARIAKVDKMFDDAINKLKSGGAAYSTFIPISPKTLAAALEGMKKAYHAGEKIATLIEDAIDYINKEVGGGWDKDAFRKEWEGKLGEHDVKKELPADKREKILERFRKKLKGLSESEKDEVIRKSFKKLVENGALDYADFKKIIADTLGYGEMSAEQAKQIVDLVERMNKVEEFAAKVRESDRSEKALDEYLAAKKDAEKAATELAKIVHNKPEIIKRVLSIMQLNTLGPVSLMINVVFNVVNQLGVRVPRSLMMTAIDKAIQGGGKLFGKDIKPENNIIAAQKGFYPKALRGIKESLEQFRSGLTNKDYFQKEIYSAQIHPATSLREIWDYGRSSDTGNKIAKALGRQEKGRKVRYTTKQLVDKALQGTFGVTGEAVARTLNLGDKWQRYGTEGGQAAIFAENLGLKGVDRKIFEEFPKEEAYRKLISEGMSEEAAMKKAEEIQQRIIREGEESVFQEDNLLNDAITAAFKPFGQAGSIIKTLNMPYVKTPLNAFWTVYNLVNPEVALLQSAIYGAKALKTKSASDIQNAKKWLAHAATGVAWMAVTGSLAKAGIVNAGNDDDTTKKERQGETFYEQQNTINMSKLAALMQGKDPDKVKNGLLVDTKWLGSMGIVMGYQAQRLENMTPEQKAAQQDYMEDFLSRMKTSTLDFINNGVFSNTGAFFIALSKGGAFMDGYALNLINMGTNIVHPAAAAQLSRAQLPYYSKVKADTFMGEIKNSMLTRSSWLRKLSGQYPDSKVSIWGDRLDKKDNAALRLFGMSRQNDDNFAQPIYNDYKRTSNTRFFPSSIKPTVKIGDKNVKLTAKETAELETLVGQSRKQLIAPYINDMAVFEGSDKKYSQLTDEEKIDNLNILYEEGYENGLHQFTMIHPEYAGATKSVEQETKEAEERAAHKQLRAAAKDKLQAQW